MELICPSCEARYQLPDGAIGEKGRQVSCMSCGHVWHAYPPLVLGAPERAARPASTGIPFGTASGGRPAAAEPKPAHLPGKDDEVMTSGGIPDRAAGSRTEQLAEIREMLAEVQAEETAAAAPSPAASEAPRPTRDTFEPSRLRASSPAETAAASIGAVVAPTARLDNTDEEVDALRARLQQQSEKPAKGKEVDVKSIRRKHDRKERARKRDKAAGSGAFLTGFLLVVMVVAVMIGLYVLHPAIISKLPGTEPALTEYVATIDGLRVSVAETFEKAKSWVTERTDKG